MSESILNRIDKKYLNENISDFINCTFKEFCLLNNPFPSKQNLSMAYKFLENTIAISGFQGSLEDFFDYLLKDEKIFNGNTIRNLREKIVEYFDNIWFNNIFLPSFNASEEILTDEVIAIAKDLQKKNLSRRALLVLAMAFNVSQDQMDCKTKTNLCNIIRDYIGKYKSSLTLDNDIIDIPSAIQELKKALKSRYYLHFKCSFSNSNILVLIRRVIKSIKEKPTEKYIIIKILEDLKTIYENHQYIPSYEFEETENNMMREPEVILRSKVYKFINEFSDKYKNSKSYKNMANKITIDTPLKNVETLESIISLIKNDSSAFKE